MKDLTAKQKIERGKAGLVLDHFFFGSLVCLLNTKEDPKAETAWADGVTLGYNPAFIDGLTLPQVKGMLAHEVMHCAMAHMSRRGTRDPMQWNMAADLAINPILEAAGFTLPGGAYSDPTFRDMAAEEIYIRIGDKSGQTGPSKTAPESRKWGQNQKMGQTQGVDKGSGEKCDPGGCGEVRDAPAPDGGPGSAADRKQAEGDWKVATIQAAQAARLMGEHLPGEIARMVDAILDPKAPWQEILRRFISQLAKEDYSWRVPNRRFIHDGLYLPSMMSDKIGEIVLAVDTSGSIRESELAQFAAELTCIVEDIPGVTVHVLYIDSQIRGKVETFTADNLPIELHPAGGGGTDFKPAFQWVEDHPEIRPAALIYLTDLCGKFPDYEPPYPTLWGVIGSGNKQPPFGEVIKL